ncbi:MAG: hypothetical protein SGI84_04855, partial [Gemmatimonadota bacterium]|nr:hypothetical protein [Gemmatimonadota bacterium]
LLMGPGTAEAITVLVSKRATAVTPDQMAGNFIRTRLLGVVRPTATVAVVNAALLAAGARVDGSEPGSPFLTLRIQAASDEAAARAVGNGLVASGAFWLAIP